MTPSATLFQPALFAHGRLLWRFEGSDACRLSPKLAWRMVESGARFATDHRGAVLWDPFCGTGLLPALAGLFFGGDFGEIWASDVDPRAVETTRRNLALATDPAAALERKRHAIGLSGRNAKSARRWGDVADYVDVLMPHIGLAAERGLPLRARSGAAHGLALPAAPTLIIGDAPYGRSTHLVGPPFGDVLAAWVAAPQVVWIDLLVTEDQAEQASERVPDLQVHRAPGGRRRMRYAAEAGEAADQGGGA